MRLRPLQEWLCDGCGAVIPEVAGGWVEWLLDMSCLKSSGFRIVHEQQHSPRHPYSTCYTGPL